jgi:hypothetical protein
MIFLILLMTLNVTSKETVIFFQMIFGSFELTFGWLIEITGKSYLEGAFGGIL